MKSRILLGVLVAAVTAASLLVALAEPVRAAFPGENGKIVFTSDRDGNLEIYAMNPDGSGLTNLTNNPGYDGDPDWSSDGSKIVFVSDRDGRVDQYGRKLPEIYVMNADGSDPTPLTSNEAVESGPTWSPDSLKIAFSSYTFSDSGYSQLHTMDADGSDQIRLTNNPGYDSEPDWSPDGSKIAFRRFGAGENDDGVHVLSADGKVTRLTDFVPSGPITDEGDPDWSPDGSKILFSRLSYGGSGSTRSEVWVMNADGSEVTTLGEGTVPAWSPDGTKIVFSYYYDSTNVYKPTIPREIYVMNPDGSERTNLTNNQEPRDSVPDWGVEPDSAPTPPPTPEFKPEFKPLPDPRGCTITGTEDKDDLRGTPGPDVICGLGGDDTIRGLAGEDTVYGDGGDDTLLGDEDADRLVGGSGKDTFRGGSGKDTCKAKRGEITRECP